MSHVCRFSAFDTWFFRESRPHSSVGAPFLASCFPPPPRTVSGAVRFLVGESLGVDWAAFRTNGDAPFSIGGLDLRALIGWGRDLGSLDLQGPWLTRVAGDRAVRLYRAPRFLLTNRAGDGVARFRIGPATTTDLGRLHLPELPPGCQVRLPVDDFWLSETELAAVLQGATPGPDDLLPRDALVAEEARLGIARDAERASARVGLLYQTRHLRPRPDLAVEADIVGLPDSADLDPRVLRLGGEGRPSGATWRRLDTPPFPAVPTPDARSRGLILVLLTAADLGGDRWLPVDDPEPVTAAHGAQAWRGRLAGVDLEVVTAMIGSAEREGGWDLANRRPRPVQSLVSAGSAWYCRVLDEGRPVDDSALTDAIRRLHGLRLGSDTRLGRGHLAVGLWTDDEFPNDLDHDRHSGDPR